MIAFETQAISSLIAISQELAGRGWLRATSGNLSIRDREADLIYITRSGADKQRLDSHDILTLTPDGTVISGVGKPSFETAIHQAIYRLTDAGAVFHVHTVYNNVACRYVDGDGLRFQDHEMLKALGHWEEDAAIILPVVPNFAHIPDLARAVEEALDPSVPAVLLRRHGIYAFGDTAEAAFRHLEAFEFLFEWLYLDQLTGATIAPSLNS